MDKIDHLMAEKIENNKNSQKRQVTQKIFKKKCWECFFEEMSKKWHHWHPSNEVAKDGKSTFSWLSVFHICSYFCSSLFFTSLELCWFLKSLKRRVFYILFPLLLLGIIQKIIRDTFWALFVFKLWTFSAKLLCF
jgi:hypothetical protein